MCNQMFVSLLRSVSDREGSGISQDHIYSSVVSGKMFGCSIAQYILLNPYTHTQRLIENAKRFTTILLAQSNDEQ